MIKNFIQVGSHDGVMHDPLREFILQNNWKGLLIEPQKEMLEQCKNNYVDVDNLTFVNCAVHPTESFVKLYKVNNAQDYSHTGWASIDPNRFSNTIYENSFIEEKVKAKPLMKIINENKFFFIDLLQIDTEGFDSEVIEMLDFNVYKPTLIQYEHKHLSNNQKNKTVNSLSSKGYFTIDKKNDTIAIQKELITGIFILKYIFLRLIESISSRFNNYIQTVSKKN